MHLLIAERQEQAFGIRPRLLHLTDERNGCRRWHVESGLACCISLMSAMAAGYGM